MRTMNQELIAMSVARIFLIPQDESSSHAKSTSLGRPVPNDKIHVIRKSHADTALSVLAFLVFLMIVSTTAGADAVTEHFNKGMELYKAKRYDAAIEELESARRLSPENDT